MPNFHFYQYYTQKSNAEVWITRLGQRISINFGLYAIPQPIILMNLDDFNDFDDFITLMTVMTLMTFMKLMTLFARYTRIMPTTSHSFKSILLPE